MKEMQLKAFVKMCVVCYVWCLLVNVVVVVFFHFSQRTKGAKCLQTLHNINRLVGRCCFCVCVCYGPSFGALVCFIPFCSDRHIVYI